MAEPKKPDVDPAFLRGGEGSLGALIAKYDWSTTSIGPLRAWPRYVRNATGTLLRSAVPMALFWGEDGVTIYNDAYSLLLGRQHPGALGSSVRETSPFAGLDEQALKAVLAGKNLALRDVELSVNRSGEPKQVWVNIDCSPVLDDRDRPAGVLAVVVEATARMLAERKAAMELDRLRRIFQQSPAFIALLRGPDHVYEFVNDAHKRLFGDRNLIGKSIREAFADVADQGFPQLIDKVWATKEGYVARGARALLPKEVGGQREEHFLDYLLQPVTGDNGEVVAIFLEGFDVTDHVHSQAAVEESNRLLTAATAVARLGVFEVDQQTGAATLNARAREIYGFGPHDKVTIADMTARIDSGDFLRITAEAAAAGERRARRLVLEYRIHMADGSTRNIASVSDRTLNSEGRLLRAVGVFHDVTERRRAEQRQRMLINELNHRVKNTLATVQSIAAQTLRAAPDLTSAREAFEARLVALSSAHNLLNLESWQGAPLSEVVAVAMAPFEGLQRPQISRSGPPVWLAPQHALAFSMAVHELATNAVSYGALSCPEGHVTVHWDLGESDELLLTWREEGGPPVTPPARTGFGCRLLQRSLARELNADVAMTFEPDGVRWQIRFQVEPPCPAPTFEIPDV